ncbi:MULTISPECIES: hypothetical protein [unclassified Chryseobacterium]|uniref:hypothetical protein n=1 Tax=unclassified Chryseobacterium TaxID=2593645 RepID=UPI001AE15DD7|nr:MULTISPECIES: hypothetical protein [unclassified Chryseobacterium]MBP1168080.1 hypothetical protein [Chryseobacterium sp. PvR013]MDR4892632.1 hypothetical protein [Chryseobacterium sp. CFS7]
MKIRFLYLILILIIIGCKKANKKEVLLADREAPLGWIYLKMYDDNSFEFISHGMMRDNDVYSGSYSLKNDTLYFKYKDSIPTAGSKAVIEKGFVYYLNGDYHESVQIKLNKLSIQK